MDWKTRAIALLVRLHPQIEQQMGAEKSYSTHLRRKGLLKAAGKHGRRFQRLQHSLKKIEELLPPEELEALNTDKHG